MPEWKDCEYFNLIMPETASCCRVILLWYSQCEKYHLYDMKLLFIDSVSEAMWLVKTLVVWRAWPDRIWKEHQELRKNNKYFERNQKGFGGKYKWLKPNETLKYLKGLVQILLQYGATCYRKRKMVGDCSLIMGIWWWRLRLHEFAAWNTNQAVVNLFWKPHYVRKALWKKGRER